MQIIAHPFPFIRIAKAAALGLALNAAAARTHAFELSPDAVFLEAGVAEKKTSAVTVGATWPWSLSRQWLGGRLSGYTEVFASVWKAQPAPGSATHTLLGLVPMVRYELPNDYEPWFIEGGIGISVFDHPLRSANMRLSTAWNFYDVVALGRRFGNEGQHEMSLRVSHLSNGGLKEPNPGRNILLLRYATRF